MLDTLNNMAGKKGGFSINFLLNKQDITPSLDYSSIDFSKFSSEYYTSSHIHSLPPISVNRATSHTFSDNEFSCEWSDCALSFADETLLTEHIIEKHVGRGLSEYVCLINNCSRLHRPFQKRQKLLNHLRTHTGERPFACSFPNCSKKFARLDSLKSHEKIHFDHKEYICPFINCKKSFSNQKLLNNHKLSHFKISSSNSIDNHINGNAYNSGIINDSGVDSNGNHIHYHRHNAIRKSPKRSPRSYSRSPYQLNSDASDLSSSSFSVTTSP
ncbi:hypothetical protein BB560_006933 [Smittium megazygosporum]|uniref:C2H2-type domain-containing protein n=1 Tax=Smittium megazygosporum TaxID=133381 RepID=A0A2T9Y061_9FUNG|nr:hypothetical protein BB560_006933 [Smittium megazygosporum]